MRVSDNSDDSVVKEDDERESESEDSEREQ